MSSLWSIGGGMYRDGSSGGDGNAEVRHPDNGSKGSECAGGAMHLARRSPVEDGDS
ncbi:hypothetical protein Tco_0616906, partial [Tanacetum coccineum]